VSSKSTLPIVCTDTRFLSCNGVSFCVGFDHYYRPFGCVEEILVIQYMDPHEMCACTIYIHVCVFVSKAYLVKLPMLYVQVTS